jgi:hypothetical protein
MTQPYTTGGCCPVGTVWVAGDFIVADGVGCHQGIMRIDADGTGFVNPAISTPPFGALGMAVSMVKHNGTIWAGGSFLSINPSGGPPVTPSQPRNVCSYIPAGQGHGAGWQGYAYSGMGLFACMHSFGGTLYAGGGLGVVSGPTVMEWTGQDWNDLGFPTTFTLGTVDDLTSRGGLLYALPRGSNGMLNDPAIAAYDGFTWSSVPTNGLPIAGIFSPLRRFHVWNGNLYLTTSGGVFRFTGTAWVDSGPGLPLGGAGAVCTHRGIMHVGAADNRVYFYDGVAWSMLQGSANCGGPLASAGASLYWTNGAGGVYRFDGVATIPVGTLAGSTSGSTLTLAMLAA